MKDEAGKKNPHADCRVPTITEEVVNKIGKATDTSSNIC